MTDRTPTTLDERADAAARDLRTRAAARPMPDFDPDALRVVELRARREGAPRTWRLPVAAAAAVATLVAGSATWLLVDRLADEQEVASSEDPVRPFLATAVPGDLSFAGAADLELGAAGDRPFGPLSVFADEHGDPALGVVVLHAFDIEDVAASSATDPVEVEFPGATAYELTGSGFGARTLVVVTEAGTAALVSPTLDRDALVEVATGITVDGDDAVLADGGLPAGWRHLGDQDGVETLVSPLAVMRATPGGGALTSAAVYLGDDGTRVLQVASGPASDLALAAITLVAGSTESAEVGGRPALLATSVTGDPASDATIRTLTWHVEGGELVQVAGLGLSAEDLLAVARGVEPTTAEEWRDLLRRTQLGEFTPATGNEGGEDTLVVEVGRGTFADGTEWVLRAEDDGSGALPDLAVALGGAGGSSSSSTGTSSEEGGPVPPLYAHVEIGRGERRFAGGLVSDEVAHLVFLDGTGAVVGDADPVIGAGYRGWVAEYVGTLEVVAQDASGGELARIVITPGGSSSGGTTPTTVDGG